MKNTTDIKTKPAFTKFSNGLIFKYILIVTVIYTGLIPALFAQEVKFAKPTWWFGSAVAANYNIYHGAGIQNPNNGLAIPTALLKGNGIGVFALPLVEYHPSNSNFGIMFQAGFDRRSGAFDQVPVSGSPAEHLSASLAYITIEPSIRLNLFNSPFYIYAGPRLAFNVDKRFTYLQGTNSSEQGGVFSDINNSIISMQFGGGYDINLSPLNKRNQVILAPFVAFHPFFGQRVRSSEAWNLTTLRAGIAIKFGRGHKITASKQVEVPVTITGGLEIETAADKLQSAKRNESNGPALRDHVYFNLDSSGSHSDTLQLQKTVKFNFLNVLGDRMVANASSSVSLVGWSETDPVAAGNMAESVKIYLTRIFGIDPSRVVSRVSKKQKGKAKESTNGKDLAVLLEGDRSVSVETDSPVLKNEFRNNPDGISGSARSFIIQEAAADSYVTFDTGDKADFFSSWSLDVTDQQGAVKKFGPFETEVACLPVKSILGTRPEGDYEIRMIGQLQSGKVLRKETSLHLVLWTPPTPERTKRLSIVYEFNNPTSIDIFNNYLTNIVVPEIPKNGTVIIHGHTNIIDTEDYDLKVSLNRANDAKKIMENALSKIGRSDVDFEVHGYGKDMEVSLSDNNPSTERFYKRTVIVDIAPNK